MADKKEINILLLGIVAILAIVGLVLMFQGQGATGKIAAAQKIGLGADILMPQGYTCDAAPLCANGARRTQATQFIDADGTLHAVCTCPALSRLGTTVQIPGGPGAQVPSTVPSIAQRQIWNR